MPMPTVTVYVLCHNYGRYLRQAIESVLAQSFLDWELIVVNDGSRDETAEIIADYQARYPKKLVSIHHKEPLGLQRSANAALQLARGRYVMRLDADDYLDESALLVMVNYLDSHPDTALVYPNYFYVDEYGNVLGVEDRKRVGQDTDLLDLPAHGACTMVRKRVLKSVGGYSETFDRQDGYELWLKVVNRYPVGNVSTPLFYYRQHGESLSRNEEQLLSTRYQITSDLVNQHKRGPLRPRLIGVVLAKNTYQHLPNIVLTEVDGKPLINYTLDVALEASLDQIIVTTDDPAVVSYCEAHYPQVIAITRPDELVKTTVWESRLLCHAVSHVEAKIGITSDIVASLSIHAPLRTVEHIRNALDTLIVFNSDSVIGVYEDRNLHYLHGRSGLEPLNPSMHHRIRVEREGLYVENGAIRVLWRDTLTESDMFGNKIGHIVMPRRLSYQIKHPQDVWLIEQILHARRRSAYLLPKAWKSKENQE